jgi:nicotinate-nucleotide adenylyltransferase
MTPYVCYGGTFDPFHNGHLAIALAVAGALSARVHLLPSADPPHRGAPGASAEQRASLLEAVALGETRLVVDRRELRRAGRSYSVDTLRELRVELGDARPLAWVLGGDSLLQLDTWKDWRTLFELAHLVVVPRPGLDLSASSIAARAPAVWAEVEPRLASAGDLLARPAGLLCRLALDPLRPESATDVRARIAAGGDWQSRVPAAVAERITRLGLYGAGLAGREGTGAGQGV